MSSMYVSQKQVSQAGPEGEWEVGNFKAEKDLFCSFPASVNASPTASGHDHLPSPSKTSFVFAVFTSMVHLLLQLQVKQGLEGGQGIGNKMHLGYKVIRSPLVKYICSC